MKLYTTHTIALNTAPLHTQADLILAVLKFRGPTTTDIFEDLGIKSPSSVIHRLRRFGYQINTKLIWKKTARHSREMRRAEYTLNSKRIIEYRRPLRVNSNMEDM